MKRENQIDDQDSGSNDQGSPRGPKRFRSNEETLRLLIPSRVSIKMFKKAFKEKYKMKRIVTGVAMISYMHIIFCRRLLAL